MKKRNKKYIKTYNFDLSVNDVDSRDDKESLHRLKLHKIKKVFQYNNDLLKSRNEVEKVLLLNINNSENVAKLMKGYDFGLLDLLHGKEVNIVDESFVISKLVKSEGFSEDTSREIYYFWKTVLAKYKQCRLDDIIVANYDDGTKNIKVFHRIFDYLFQAKIDTICEIRFISFVDDINSIKGTLIENDNSKYLIKHQGNILKIYTECDEFLLPKLVRCNDINKLDDNKYSLFNRPFDYNCSYNEFNFFKLFNNLNKVIGIENINFESGSSVFSNLKLKSFEIIELDHFGNIEFEKMFYKCKELESAIIYDVKLDNLSSMAFMFADCYNIKKVQIHLDVKTIKNLNYMFAGCINLQELDLNIFTSNVETMSGIFAECRNLTGLDLKHFNTSKVIDMSNMFIFCEKTKKLDLSNFNTQNVHNMEFMFARCTQLKDLVINNFNTSNVVSMRDMFLGCSSLESLDLSSFDTTNVTDMQEMFAACKSINKLNVENFNFSNVKNISRMFQNCKNLKVIKIGNSDFDNEVEFKDLFLNCKTDLVILYKNRNFSPEGFVNYLIEFKKSGTYNEKILRNHSKSTILFYLSENISQNCCIIFLLLYTLIVIPMSKFFYFTFLEAFLMFYIVFPIGLICIIIFATYIINWIKSFNDIKESNSWNY